MDSFKQVITSQATLADGTLSIDSDSSFRCIGSGDFLNMTLIVTVRAQPTAGDIVVVVANTTSGSRLPASAFRSVTAIYDLSQGQSVCVLLRATPTVSLVIGSSGEAYIVTIPVTYCAQTVGMFLEKIVSPTAPSYFRVGSSPPPNGLQPDAVQDYLLKVNLNRNFLTTIKISYVAVSRWSGTGQFIQSWQSGNLVSGSNALALTFGFDDEFILDASLPSTGAPKVDFTELRVNSSLFVWIDTPAPGASDIFCVEFYGPIPIVPLPASRNTWQAQVCQNNQESLGTPFLSLVCPSTPAYVSSPYMGVMITRYFTAPLSFMVESGSLPTGLSLQGQSSQALVSGTPISTGSPSFSVRVTDSQGKVASATNCAIPFGRQASITQCPADCASSGTSYSSSFQSFDAQLPTLWTVSSGALPDGLFLSASSGNVFGTPGLAGSFTFTVGLDDGRTAPVVFRTCTINVLGAPTASCLQASVWNQFYPFPASFRISVTNLCPTISFSVTGTIPGVTLNSTTGAVVGSPSTQGTFAYSAIVTGLWGTTVSVNCSLLVNPRLRINCPPSGQMFGNVGQFFSRSFLATGGTPPYTFLNYYNFPSWLSGSATGVISGTLSGNTFNYSNLIGGVIDAAGETTGSTHCPLRVYLNPSFSMCPPSGAIIGSFFRFDMSADVPNMESPPIFSVADGFLPSGISILSNGTLFGSVSGSPGTSNFQLQVTDASGSVARSPACAIVTSLSAIITVKP